MNFVLDDNKVYFSDKDSTNYKKLGTIKCSFLSDLSNKLNICCTDALYKILEPTNDFKITCEYRFKEQHLSILRSQLQKSVRRNKVDICLKTAVSMISIGHAGMFELVRRLTIIVVEDSMLSHDYIFLVWLLCCLTKHDKLHTNRYIVTKLLQIVHQTVCCPFKDHSWKPLTKPVADKEQKIYKNILSSNNDILKSILIRRTFNGMVCDNKMLFNSAKIWLNRFNSNSRLINYLKRELKPINELNFIGLTLDEIQPESVDFHCSNIDKVISELVGIDTDTLREIIWNISSCINLKMDIEIDILQDINIIEISKFRQYLFLLPLLQSEAKKIVYKNFL